MNSLQEVIAESGRGGNLKTADARSNILGAIRRNKPDAQALPDIPIFDHRVPATPTAFAEALALVGGQWDDTFAAQRPDAKTLGGYIRQLFPQALRFCSAVEGIADVELLNRDAAPYALDKVDVAIVRARFGVAETGSVWLSEEELGVNTLGYLAQHLVVLLDPQTIVSDLHAAYDRDDFTAVHYAVLMSGPSATADIEGILIRGAQGVRSLRVLACP